MSKPKKDSCPFCKDEKKRPLNAYMRKRCQERSNGKICEEDEEPEETTEKNQQNCSSHNHHEHNKK